MEGGHSALFAPAYRLVQNLPLRRQGNCWPVSEDLFAGHRHPLGTFSLRLLQSEVLPTLIAERCERRFLGITSNLVFPEWERIFANPMATAAAIDRVVHHSFILEFDVPGYCTDVAQHRVNPEEVNRPN